MTSQINRPIIGITMGDPASIGPEITAKLLAQEQVFELCKPVVVGDAGCMERALRIIGETKLTVNAVDSISQARFAHGVIDVLNLHNAAPEQFETGKVSAYCGEAAFRYVEKVIELALAEQIDATVTNALSKEAINLAGHHFAGHTEIYAFYCKTAKYTMMLAHNDLRVVHVSTHVSLREACDRVKKERVIEVIRIAHDACKKLGINDPKIAVAGLNPHCGENGLFGTEEIKEIIPAVQEAQAHGIRAEGPIPPDTVFSKAKGGWYNIVVAMYHDQGHIPLKLEGFVYNRTDKKWDAVNGVNITLGLPIIRTSVDHGTAFDQAGTGSASDASLLSALQYAVRMAVHSDRVCTGTSCR